MAEYSAKIAARSAREIQLESGTIKIPLDEYVLKVLPKDLLTVLRGVSYQELNAQITNGNAPSQVLVDGRAIGAKGIDQARRAVSMRFADTNLLVAAVIEIYNLLQRVTRLQSPAKNEIVARKNFHLWLDGRPLGLMPGALSKITRAGALNSKSVVRVVGPLVNYGRKLYWSPIGRGKKVDLREVTNASSGRSRFVYNDKYSPRFKPYSARTLRRIANRGKDPAGTLGRLQALRPGYVEGTSQIVKRIMRRNRLFAALYISDGWVNYPPAKTWGKTSRDDRVPSISAQLAKRGGVRVINI